MPISAMRVKNFRALKEIPLITFSQMPVIIGRNDAGKSTLLHSLAVFFEERSLQETDFCSGAGQIDQIEIEVRFTNLNEASMSNLRNKGLLNSAEELVVKKTYDHTLKPIGNSLYVYDFVDLDFQNLQSKKEKELNDLGAKYGLSFRQAGQAITNEVKVAALKGYANQQGFAKSDVWVIPDKDNLAEVKKTIPKFILFPSEMVLTTEQSAFQHPFQQMIGGQLSVAEDTKDSIESKVKEAISEALKSIEANLTEETDSVTELIPKPSFQWQKLVTLNIETKDQFGVTVPISSRGQGVQRLLMVAFLKYMAERTVNTLQPQRIYAIEEPETYLHPRAQRDLIEALLQLKRSGNQVLVTSHSPVFASEAAPEDIILVTRQSADSKIMQNTEVNTEMVVKELGILPRDAVAGYTACVFVEGPADQYFLETISDTLQREGKIMHSLKDKGIGVITVAGNNLKFFVEKELILKRLNRRFAVLVDSDKSAPQDQIKGTVLHWKQKCVDEGGRFFILRKREIENYLHPCAIKRSLGKTVDIQDFTDVKKMISPNYDWNKHLKPIVNSMTAAEVLERDKYTEDNSERHEILEMIEEMLHLGDK